MVTVWGTPGITLNRMAEESRPLEEKKETLGMRPSREVNTAPNTSSDRLSEATISGNAGRNFRGTGAPVEHQTMGNSNQPTSGNAGMSEAGASTAICGGLSGRTLSEAGNFRGARAAASELSLNGNAEMSKSEPNPAFVDEGCPSSLRSCSTCTSYSLEISLTTSGEKEFQPLPLQTPRESLSGQNKQINHSIHPEETRQATVTNSHRSAVKKMDQPAESMAAKVSQCVDLLGSCQIVTSKRTNEESNVEKTFSSIASGAVKLGAQPTQPLNSPSLPSFEKCKEKRSEEDEEMFYAFVILHAPEDAEEAARLKNRLERISSTTGAVFADDFAEPGRSVFSCVEDAIENSAFIMLLLTPNFNTHLNEMSTDSALMNSIEKPHKYNTVIPLLPWDNSLAQIELPMILRTRIPMKEKEDRAFEMMARKLLDPGKIQRQKKIWKGEQCIRKQKEIQRQLQEENRRRANFIRESTRVAELEKQRMQLLKQEQHLLQPHLYQGFSGGAQQFGPGPQWQGPEIPHYSGSGCNQPPSNIHIQNAKYIMIGNDSTMTVGGRENNSSDEDCM